jgi:hypothetical protein
MVVVYYVLYMGSVLGALRIGSSILVAFQLYVLERRDDVREAVCVIVKGASEFVVEVR